MGRPFASKVGDVHYDWTVIGISDTRTFAGGTVVVCKCKCGTVREIPSGHLRLGIRKQCKSCSDNEKRNRPRTTPIHNKKPEGEAQRNELFYRYKKSALKRNIPFFLNMEEFEEIVKRSCFYCGIAPQQRVKSNNGVYIYNGIDRVDNDKGYIMSNVVPCCKFCNRAKDTLSVEQFMQKVSDIMRHAKEYFTGSV